MRALAAAVAMVAVLGACGGGGGGGGSQPAGSTKVTMTEYSFNPSNITVANGKVVFYLVNAGGLSHDLVIYDKSSGAKVAGSELISAGDSFVFTVSSLAAGSYDFDCDQPGHKASGMKGTLTVT